MHELREHIERTLGQGVAALAPLGGGDVADAYRVTLSEGAPVFAKTRRAWPPGFFITEAAGLAWLREAGTVPVPEVLAVSDDPPALILEWIEPGRSAASTEANFGRALATLHASGAPCFGREDRRSTGSRGLPNEPCDTWSEFYASNRLHGDLWGGNRLVGRGGVSWLIDPAAHGGHREFDLAMMRLFGGFGKACYAAYAETTPLAEGWPERVPLHQLAPLVVHAIKFGGGYAAEARRALDAFC